MKATKNYIKYTILTKFENFLKRSLRKFLDLHPNSKTLVSLKKIFFILFNLEDPVLIIVQIYK